MIPIGLYIGFGTIFFFISIVTGLVIISEGKETLKGILFCLSALSIIFIPFFGDKGSTTEKVNLVAHLTSDGVPYVEHDGKIVPIGMKIERNIMEGDKIVATRHHLHHTFLIFVESDWEYVKDSK